MDLTHQRRVLNALTIAIVAGACGGGYWAVSEIESSGATQSRRGSVVAPSPSTIRANDDGLAAVSIPSLRGPLYDPPPVVQRPPTVKPQPAPPPPPQNPPKARLDVRLVGTIIDAERSVAIVSDASGKLDVKSRGETLELSPPGITIDAIDAAAVTLSYQGRQSTIELDRTTGAGGGGYVPPGGLPPANPYGSSRANRRRNQ